MRVCTVPGLQWNRPLWAEGSAVVARPPGFALHLGLLTVPLLGEADLIFLYLCPLTLKGGLCCSPGGQCEDKHVTSEHHTAAQGTEQTAWVSWGDSEHPRPELRGTAPPARLCGLALLFLPSFPVPPSQLDQESRLPPSPQCDRPGALTSVLTTSPALRQNPSTQT